MINNCKNRNSQDSQRPMIHKYKKKGTREYNFSLFSGPAKQMISHCCDEPSNRFVLTNVSVEPIAIRGCFMRKQAPVFLQPTILLDIGAEARADVGIRPYGSAPFRKSFNRSPWFWLWISRPALWARR